MHGGKWFLMFRKDFSCSSTIHILQNLTKIKGYRLYQHWAPKLAFWGVSETRPEQILQKETYLIRTQMQGHCAEGGHISGKIWSIDLWKLIFLFLVLIAPSMVYNHTKESNITQQTLYFSTVAQKNHLQEIDTDAMDWPKMSGFSCAIALTRRMRSWVM